MSVTTMSFPSDNEDIGAENLPMTTTLRREFTVPPANCCVFIEWDDVLFPTTSVLESSVAPGDTLPKDYTTALSGLLTELILKCRNDGLFIISEKEPGWFARALRDYLPPDIADVIRRRFQFIHVTRTTCAPTLKSVVLSLGDPSTHVVLMSWRASVLSTAEELSRCVPEGFVKCVRFSRALRRGMLGPRLRSVLGSLERIMTLRRHTTFVLCNKKVAGYQRSTSTDSASTTDGTGSVQRSLSSSIP
ncbi:hypothetical protein FOZ63_033226 [Perkinsus olseni]|uniref:Uncharacterized protein n=1 Tax=Perkinsus olseni TaxID=32597 RepID=A0A7J6UNF6_PEROL|nr:hypothetical protein FOZ63_033226 [Perkinsus olseni]